MTSLCLRAFHEKASFSRADLAAIRARELEAPDAASLPSALESSGFGARCMRGSVRCGRCNLCGDVATKRVEARARSRPDRAVGGDSSRRAHPMGSRRSDGDLSSSAGDA